MNICWERTLAWKYLRDAGIDPAQVEDRHFPGEFWRDEPKEEEPQADDAEAEKQEDPSA